MNEYTKKRNALVAEAQALIDAGDRDGANAKMAEINALDAEFEECRTLEANLRALEGNSVVPEALAKAEKMNDAAPMTAEDAIKSDIYRIAWAKTMMGAQLSSDEAAAYKMVDEYTHTTSNTGIVVPETVTKGIWEEVGELYPYWNDISKTYVNGNLTMLQEDTSTDAAWYDEDTATEDGTETFTSYTLTGCELSRAITVSWKLKEMAIEDFIPYITRKMAKKMGAALGYGVINGQGQPGSSDTFLPEPLGVVTALKEDGEQVKEASTLDYAALINTRALVKSGYGAGLNIYANSNTIWTGLAAITDENGRPIFYVDPVNNGGVGKVLGCTVKEDAAMSDGEILFSNPSLGYSSNINKDMSILTDDHAKARTTDYVAYAIVDGAPITLKAHALLVLVSESE